MWNIETIEMFLQERPNGGIAWALSRRTVRYLRAFYPKEGTVVAILTELVAGKKNPMGKREPGTITVGVFVRTPEEKGLVELKDIKEILSKENFSKVVLSLPLLKLLDKEILPEVEKFLISQNETAIPTW